MSPEQVSGRPIDRRSDIFALGVVLFECLTLKRLFVGQSDVQTLLNIREADVEQRFRRHSYLPKPIRAILAKALAKDPDDRYQTATDFQEAILDYLFDSRLKVSSRHVATFMEQLLNPVAEAVQPPSPPPSEAPDAHVPPPVPPSPPTSPSLRPKALRRVDLSRATFHFRHDDDTVFGPVDFDRLISLLAERAIGPREWVSINGSDWMRVEDVRAVVDLQPSLFETETTRPLDDGPLNRFRTPALLFRIAQHRLTGKLKLRFGSIQKELYFDKGEPRFAHSNLKTDLFGTFLVTSGLLEPSDLERALERVITPQTHLGHSLADLGILSEARVNQALAEHLHARIAEIMTWREGWYEFFEGVLPPRDTGVQSGDLIAVVMNAIRHHYGLAELRTIVAGLLDHTLIVGGGSRDAALVHRLALLPEEERMRPALRTGITLRVLLEAASISEQAQLYLLRAAFALHQLDHLAFRAPRT
jgi:hypothetical protein